MFLTCNIKLLSLSNGMLLTRTSVYIHVKDDHCHKLFPACTS